MKYFAELQKAMSFLANDPRTIFIGQAIEYEGTGLYESLKHIDKSKKIELPVIEYFQCGLANGLAIDGMIPVSVFPRWNFFLLGIDQIVNHLDKFILMSNGKCMPKVIIRVAVGSESPIDPQHQHKGNFTQSIKGMLSTINIVELLEPQQIVKSYEKALLRDDGVSTILVEHSDFCKTK